MASQLPTAATEVSGGRMRGTVKWFERKKGYGFIGGIDGKDYFVHQKHIKSKGFRQLQEKQEVEFDVVFGTREGNQLNAVNVSGPGGSFIQCNERKQPNICYNYRKGKGFCSWGKDCKFSHDLGQGRPIPVFGGRGMTQNIAMLRNDEAGAGRGVCFSWQRGECFRGESCKFEHSGNPMYSQHPEKNTGLCYLWQEGKCNMGKFCKFYHFPTE